MRASMIYARVLKNRFGAVDKYPLLFSDLNLGIFEPSKELIEALDKLDQDF